MKLITLSKDKEKIQRQLQNAGIRSRRKLMRQFQFQDADKVVIQMAQSCLFTQCTYKWSSDKAESLTML